MDSINLRFTAHTKLQSPSWPGLISGVVLFSVCRGVSLQWNSFIFLITHNLHCRCIGGCFDNPDFHAKYTLVR